MTEQWQELKETITEMRDNDGTGTQQEVCKFLVNYMEVLEKQMEEPKIGHWIYDDEYSDWFDVTYNCSCCKRAIIVPYDARNEVYKDYPYCHCGAKMIESEGRNE